MTAKDVAEFLRSFNYHYWKESTLQDGVQTLLDMGGIDYRREVILGEKARIDFMIDNIGLEVKVGGSTPKVELQLKRYARFEEVSGLVLMTNRLRHRYPEKIEGKELEIVHLTMNAL